MSTLSIASTKLDDDSLLIIFEIITLSRISRDPHRPQAVIRAASQVCRRWRQLLIQSPWIWGRVVDLGVVDYGPRRTEWMQEVLRRAGESAPLWVSGKVNVSKTVGPRPKFDSEAFFLRVIELLERIERVSLVIHGHKIPSRITRPFLSRAPILKLFSLEFPNIREPVLLKTLQPESSKRLFADYAPCLEDICAVNVAIRVDSLCLSKIRKICLRSLDHFSLQNILALLQHTPSLQSLVIGIQYTSIHSTSLLTPNLDVAPPKLSYIGISSDLWVASKILGYVVPGELSVFQLLLQDAPNENMVDQDVLASFARSLPSFISSYFAFNKPTKLYFRVSLTGRLFYFSDITASSSLFRPDGTPTFIIQGGEVDPEFVAPWLNQGEVDDEAVITCLIRAFSGASASHYQFVDEIKMSLNNTFPILYSMLALFKNIHSMTTDDETCKTLLELEGDAGYPRNEVLFPKLHTLCLTRISPLWSIWSRTDSRPPACYTNVVEFLSHRKKIGFPVAKLDTRTGAQEKMKSLHDLRGLEQVGGLEVIWTQLKPGLEGMKSVEVCSYTCGSGDPQRLNVDV